MVNNAVHPRVELAAHPLRELLNDEFHARPPLPLTSPVLVSHLVLTQDSAVLAGERNRLCRLAQIHAGKLLTSSDTCLVFDGGPSQLVHYLAKGGKMLFPEISPEIAAAVSIPLIAGFLMLGIRRMRRRLRQAEDSEH